MKVDHATWLIENNLVYKPGWSFSATDRTNRFEGGVNVKVTYPAHDSEPSTAPDFGPVLDMHANFTIIVADCDETELLFRILRVILDIEEHEAREFLFYAGSLAAPFHPRTIAGMKRWNEFKAHTDPRGFAEHDLRFSAA